MDTELSTLVKLRANIELSKVRGSITDNKEPKRAPFNIEREKPIEAAAWSSKDKSDLAKSKSSKGESNQTWPEGGNDKPRRAISCSSNKLPGCVISKIESAKSKFAVEKIDIGNSQQATDLSNELEPKCRRFKD